MRILQWSDTNNNTKIRTDETENKLEDLYMRMTNLHLRDTFAVKREFPTHNF